MTKEEIVYQMDALLLREDVSGITSLNTNNWQLFQHLNNKLNKATGSWWGALTEDYKQAMIAEYILLQKGVDKHDDS